MPNRQAILFRRSTAALVLVFAFAAVMPATQQVQAQDPSIIVTTYHEQATPTPAAVTLAPGETVRVLTLDQWQAVRHFAPERQMVMARIGWCESHLDPDAVGDGGHSIGAWQVQPHFWGPVPATLEAQAQQAERIAAEHGTEPWTTRDGCEGWSR